ncbi:HAD family hydrolase [Salinirubellus sp. GCM10025818]|uniref:HAD family hydrolase n=1 Tax=Salinirubellus TaxID=2162630 RepID=UPI0030D1D968
MNYDAVVYDLDGTLVDLAVDWDAVARDVEALLESRGIDPESTGLWEMWRESKGTPHQKSVHRTMADHEEAGARNSALLPPARSIPAELPVGVCSLNAESAVHVALDTHALTESVDAVVGRGSVPTEKPDPEPLLSTLEPLGVDPGMAVFVGDSDRDRVASERAGVPYRDVSDWD